MKNLPTSPANRSASVDDLFERLALRYGKHWLDMWAGLPIAAVKREWAGALTRFHRVQVDEAVNQCGKFPPTLPEFADLCAQMPRPAVTVVADGPKLVNDKTRHPIPESFREKVDQLFRRNQPTKTPEQVEQERQRQLDAVKRMTGEP